MMVSQHKTMPTGDYHGLLPQPYLNSNSIINICLPISSSQLIGEHSHTIGRLPKNKGHIDRATGKTTDQEEDERAALLNCAHVCNNKEKKAESTHEARNKLG